MTKRAFLFLGVLSTLSSSQAVVWTANVFGVMRVDSTNRETIVSVPWVATKSGADQPIAVSNLVHTSGLNAGDQLEYYNAATGKYEIWLLVRDGNRLTWQAAQNVDETNVALSTSPLMRGNALVLVRQDPLADHFYLHGQVARSGASTNALPRSSTAPVYTLLAPPNDHSVSLNDATWSNVNSNDCVLVRGKRYQFVNHKWGRWEWDPTTFEGTFHALSDAEAIPRGQGFWFVSAPCADAAAEVIWHNLPSAR